MATTRGNAVQVRRLTALSQLAALRHAWNALAGDIPFRSWEWLDSWWRSYGEPTAGGGSERQLFVQAVFDGDELIGAAPWYLERSAALGDVIRFLGDGEVCSDYLGLLSRPGREADVALAAVGSLSNAAGATDDAALAPPDWDLLDLTGLNEQDIAMQCLFDKLRESNRLVHERRGATCWRIELPATWDEYLARLSRSHRKQILRIERRLFDSGRARLRHVEDEKDLHEGLGILAELHQKRWEHRGKLGCFALPHFATFLYDVAYQHHRAGQLRLHWLELDGRPIAAEYHILAGNVVYAYQSGIEPAALRYEPGRVITLALVKQAIREGRAGFDFLRGDEAYKAHWRAEARPSVAVRVVPARGAARLRHSLWLAGGNVKTWLKSGLGLSEPDSAAGSCPAASLQADTHAADLMD